MKSEGTPHSAAGDDIAENYDSVFLHSRRETIVLLMAFVLFLAWSIGVSWSLGYGNEPTDVVATVGGIPSWVFWGVCVPWIAATGFTIWFAQFYMADDPLDELSVDRSGRSNDHDRAGVER